MKFLNKVKEAIDKHGIIGCVLFAAGSVIHFLLEPFLNLYLNKFAKVKPNRILFTSKPDFSDNAKILYEYLDEEYGNEYEYIWLVDKKDSYNVNIENTKVIPLRNGLYKGWSFTTKRAIVTSEYVFFTHGLDTGKLRNIKGQTVVNLWHGCGYKDVDKNNFQGKWIEKNPFDLALVPGDIFVKTKMKFWDCDENQILPIGYPRYDIMLKGDSSAKEYVDRLKGKSSRIVMWMPTFRKTDRGNFPEEQIQRQYDLPLVTSFEEMLMLDSICEKYSVKICLKRHPSQRIYSCEKQNFSNIVFIDNDDLKEENVELYSLLKYTDGLISDYSSIAVDYMLLDKPIAFALDDYNEYKESRGFVFEDPLKYMPGNHVYNLNDLEEYLEDISEERDLYRERRHQLLNEVHNQCDDYCKKIWKSVRDYKK